MDASSLPPPATGSRRPTARFLLAHPAHFIALGAGSGLAPAAPGTVGTLWGWLAFHALAPWMTATRWGVLIAAGVLVGVWACTLTARHLDVEDPSAIVWDEIVSFWIVLWLVTPASFWGEAAAFALFRFFDALKPGPIAWADQLFKQRAGRRVGWRQGVGIFFDDLTAALATLVVIALWTRW